MSPPSVSGRNARSIFLFWLSINPSTRRTGDRIFFIILLELSNERDNNQRWHWKASRKSHDYHWFSIDSNFSSIGRYKITSISSKSWNLLWQETDSFLIEWLQQTEECLPFESRVNKITGVRWPVIWRRLSVRAYTCLVIRSDASMCVWE